jgi:hypothetical protein
MNKKEMIEGDRKILGRINHHFISYNVLSIGDFEDICREVRGEKNE